MILKPSNTIREAALRLHEEHQGKLWTVAKMPLRDTGDLSLAYSPGVAEPCLEIANDAGQVYTYTIKGNTVAVVSDGSAVLGLGNIGAKASIPVMEGKSLLFKSFAGVDSFPVCVETQDVDEIVETVKRIAPVFGGVNLEDIAAPRCFAVEERLKQEVDIPIFHDDQHGTAIVTVAAMLNAIKIVDKRMEDLRVVIEGAGASGIAVAKLLMEFGVKDLILTDTKGCLWNGRQEGMNPYKQQMAEVTNPRMVKGHLAEALKDTDVFIGLSAGGTTTGDMVRSMRRDPIVLALSNPEPEIWPEEAADAGAKVVGTGRSDYPNQVNNVLGFPGVFRGALDVRASDINDAMKRAAAEAIAELVTADKLAPDYVIPGPFDRRVAPAVAKAVAKAAMDTGVARLTVDPEQVAENCRRMVDAVQAQMALLHGNG